MVQIDFPSGPASPNGPPDLNRQVAVGSSQVDSEAITQDSISAEREENSRSLDAPSGFTADATVPAEPYPDNQGEPGLGDPMQPAWQSERTQRTRQIALVVALGGSGFLGAVLFFGWFVRNWNEGDPPTVVANGMSDDATTSLANASEPPSEESGDKEVASADALSENSEELSTEEQMKPTPVADQTEESVAQSPPPTEPNIPAENTTDLPSDLLPKTALDPLGLESEPLTAADTNQPKPSEKAPFELPAEAIGLMDVFDMAGGKQKLPVLDTPAMADDIEIEDAAQENIDPMLTINRSKSINFKRALAIEIRLATNQNKGYPLADLMLLISQISDVPIQVDWVSFDIVGTNIRDNVTGLKSAALQPVGDILERVAESVGGVITQQETLLTLSPRKEVLDERLNQLFDLSDFGSGQSSATTTLNTFLGASDAKTMRVGPETRDRQLAVLAVEAMRRVRGIQPKISDQVYLRWAQSSSSTRLDWPLVQDGESGPQLRSPIAITGLIRRMSRNNQAVCFVNWFDASRHGMSPAHLVLPHMHNVKVGNVLNNTLQPFQLHVRSVDRNHWWIGTQASYDRFPVVVWTPPLGNQQATFVERIRASVAGQVGFESHLSIDSATGSVIMLLPRFLVRQLPKLQTGLNLAATP